MYEGTEYSPLIANMIYQQTSRRVWIEALSKLLSRYVLVPMGLFFIIGCAQFPVEWNVIPLMFLIAPILALVVLIAIFVSTLRLILPYTKGGEKVVVDFLNGKIKEWEQGSTSGSQQGGHPIWCMEMASYYRSYLNEYLNGH